MTNFCPFIYTKAPKPQFRSNKHFYLRHHPNPIAATFRPLAASSFGFAIRDGNYKPSN